MGGHELGAAVLQHMVHQGRNIVGVVVTDTDNNWYKGVDEIAVKYNITLYKEKNINNADFTEKVEDMKPDLITVVNFEQILKEQIINIPTYGCINTHASLLPKYRGRAPLNWAIINGEKETGVTVHYIEKGIDTGDIILQKKIAIGDEDYIGDILNKVKEIYPLIVDEAINLIESNKVRPLKQDTDKGFYCGKRSPKDGQIKWDKPALNIYNLVRAVSRPYPGAYTYYDDVKLIIWKAKIVPNTAFNCVHKNGTILCIDEKGVLVKAEDDDILITEYDVENQEIDTFKPEIGKIFSYKDE